MCGGRSLTPVARYRPSGPPGAVSPLNRCGGAGITIAAAGGRPPRHLAPNSRSLRDRRPAGSIWSATGRRSLGLAGLSEFGSGRQSIRLVTSGWCHPQLAGRGHQPLPSPGESSTLMTSLAVPDLGERLRRERVRRFVGRAAEVELFAARLDAATDTVDAGWVRADGLFSVLWVHGPGGIGKSALLSTYAETARAAGFRVTRLDGGRVTPTPTGIQTALYESLVRADDADAARLPTAHRDGGFGRGERCVVIIDAAERLEPIEVWLRDEFIPGLPAQSVVVLAGRRPPSEAWRADPGWRGCCVSSRCAISRPRPSRRCSRSRTSRPPGWRR